MVLQRGGLFAPLSYTSEVDRLTTEVHCIWGDYLFISVSKWVKNSKQIITSIGNFQHTDHYFFGHEFVLDKVKCKQF